MTRFRLGILQVNHDKSVALGDKFPDDSHRFRDLFDRLDRRYSYQIYMTIGGEVPQDLDEQDGYLITGSPLSVLESHDFLHPLYEFIRKCDAHNKPLIGACFGHQAIAVALGGIVARPTTGLNMGVQTTEFSAYESWMVPAQPLDLYVSHEDEVTVLPEGCKMLGSSGPCRIASFSKGNHIFTTQAHPEFNDSFMRAVFASYGAHINPEHYDTSFATLDKATDGDIFAKWADRFFHQQGHKESAGS